MSEGMNRVTLVGTLGQAPEVRTLPSGTSVMELRIATNEREKRDGEWRDHVEWHRASMFGGRVAALSRLLTAGSQVCVEGSLRTRKWKDKSGADRYSTEIRVDQLILCGGKRRQDGGWGEPAGEPMSEDEIPF